MNVVNVFNETTEIISEEQLKAYATLVLDHEKIKNSELNIIIIDNKRMQAINKEYRKLDQTTDVLAFPLDFSFDQSHDKMASRYRLLGEIYISLDKVKEQAKDFGHSLDQEYKFLVVHGTLHLLGFDHIDPEDEWIMRTKEKEIMYGQEK